MIMLHLIADSQSELFEMVNKLGINRKYIQCENMPKEHFDICLKKRKLAVSYRLKEITTRNLIKIINNKKFSI